MAEREARLEELIARLRERGGRLTPQRVAVLRVLAASNQHPGAEQIYEHIQADFPMTSLATVYKTLALLVEMGEVLEIRYCGDSTRYDGRVARSHPHLICVKCTQIKDLEIAPLDPLSKEVADRTGYCIPRYRLDFLGVCPECQEKE